MKTPGFLPVIACLLFAVSASAAVKNPDTFTHLTIGDPDSLDPAWAYDTASQNIISNIYEYLLTFKGSSVKDLEGRLATAVPSKANGLISKDGLTYTFPIRKDVKFHDGSEMTAEDVRYSLTRFMLLDRAGGPSALLLEPVLGLQSTRDDKGALLPDVYRKAAAALTADRNKLTVRLVKPYAPFLSILANWGAVVSRKYCLAHGDWDGTETGLSKFNNGDKTSSPLVNAEDGTGPFTLERWTKDTKEVVLARFPGYWRSPAKLARVIIKIVQEFATRKLQIANGDADSIYVPQMHFPQVAALPGVEVIDKLENLEAPTLLLFTFSINPTANPNIGSGRLDGQGIPPDFFADKDVRKGVAYAADCEAYIRDVMRGKGWKPKGFIPKGMLGYDAAGKTYEFSLAKAAEHFKKAWGGRVWEKGFQFTIVFNDAQPNVMTLSNMIKKNVESLNPKFKIDVRTVQWSTFLEQTQSRKIPVFVGAWQADYPDPHNFAYPLMHSQGYFPSKQSYKNPEADRLIGEAVTTLDASRREALYKKIQAIGYEDLPHVIIAQGYRFRTQRSWVKGFVLQPVFPDMPYGSYFYDLRKEEFK